MPELGSALLPQSPILITIEPESPVVKTKDAPCKFFATSSQRKRKDGKSKSDLHAMLIKQNMKKSAKIAAARLELIKNSLLSSISRWTLQEPNEVIWAYINKFLDAGVYA